MTIRARYHVAFAADSYPVPRIAGPPGPPPVGDPNTVAFFSPGGVLTDNTALTAGQVDAFQRPQIHDFRLGPTNRGAVYRLGRWQADGDPTSVTSEGYVTYGPNALGTGPSPTDGGLGFYTPNSFGVLDIINGVNGNNTFYLCGFEDGGPAAPFGLDGFIVNDNLAAPIFWVKRSDNSINARTLRVGFTPATTAKWSAGAGAPNGVVVGSPGDLYSNTAGGAGTTLWVKEAGVATNVGWVGK